MKIKDIRASVLRFPVTAPLIERPIDTYEIVFCEVETDEGHLGYGLTGRFFPRGGLGPHHDFLPLVRSSSTARQWRKRACGTRVVPSG